MKRIALPILAVVAFISCAKQGPIGPQGPKGDANVTSVTFDSITVPLNGLYTFQIPAITQAIVDSGAVNVYYEGAGEDVWYPLPQYYLYQGNLVWLILEDFQLGQATLSDVGVAAEPMNYRFDIIAAN